MFAFGLILCLLSIVFVVISLIACKRHYSGFFFFSIGLVIGICGLVSMIVCTFTEAKNTPQFDMQGCIQQCKDMVMVPNTPDNVGDIWRKECLYCCATQEVNKEPVDSCKWYVNKFLNDVAKEEIQKKQPEKDNCECHKE